LKGEKVEMNTKKVTRVEVITEEGRVYVKRDNALKVNIQLQDDERTLKIFIAKDKIAVALERLKKMRNHYSEDHPIVKEIKEVEDIIKTM